MMPICKPYVAVALTAKMNILNYILVDCKMCSKIFASLTSLFVAPLLKYAAEHGLLYNLSPDAAWTSLEQNTDVYYGCFEMIIPPFPDDLEVEVMSKDYSL